MPVPSTHGGGGQTRERERQASPPRPLPSQTRVLGCGLRKRRVCHVRRAAASVYVSPKQLRIVAVHYLLYSMGEARPGNVDLDRPAGVEAVGTLRSLPWGCCRLADHAIAMLIDSGHGRRQPGVRGRNTVASGKYAGPSARPQSLQGTVRRKPQSSRIIGHSAHKAPWQEGDGRDGAMSQSPYQKVPDDSRRRIRNWELDEG